MTELMSLIVLPLLDLLLPIHLLYGQDVNLTTLAVHTQKLFDTLLAHSVKLFI